MGKDNCNECGWAEGMDCKSVNKHFYDVIECPGFKNKGGENEMSDQDNWKHRNKGMRCGTCMFFVEKTTEAIQEASHVIGRCRRNAPTMNGWPAVFSDDWCGNHKLDETKI